MKLLFYGTIACSEKTFKHLLLLAEEIAFLNRPSIMFNNWGTVAVDSPFKQIKSGTSPVPIHTFSPPSGPVNELYSEFIKADLQNDEFKKYFYSSFKSTDFSNFFINPNDKYSDKITGTDVIESLKNDPNLLENIDPAIDIPSEKMYTLDKIGRSVTFKILLIEASIAITNALINYGDKNFIPVTDNYHMSRLFAMRGLDSTYVNDSAAIAPTLGIEIIKSLIPDEALKHLLVKDIIEYRTRTKDVYKEWIVELNRISSYYDELNIDQIKEKLPKILASEIKPKISEYHNEMKSVRDEMFKDLLEKITDWKVPTLSLAGWAAMGPAAIIGAFLISAVNTLPVWQSYFSKRKAVQRKHSLSYLLRVI